MAGAGDGVPDEEREGDGEEEKRDRTEEQTDAQDVVRVLFGIGEESPAVMAGWGRGRWNNGAWGWGEVARGLSPAPGSGWVCMDGFRDRNLKGSQNGRGGVTRLRVPVRRGEEGAGAKADGRRRQLLQRPAEAAMAVGNGATCWAG